MYVIESTICELLNSHFLFQNKFSGTIFTKDPEWETSLYLLDFLYFQF